MKKKIVLVFCLFFVILIACGINNSSLKGKKVTLIGDSITEHNYHAVKNYGIWLEEWTGCTVENLGVTTTGFRAKGETRDSNYITRVPLISEDTDIIGVACSLNDVYYTLGEVDDTSEETVFGCANVFFETLRLKFPNTPIICYIQNPRGDFCLGREDADNYVHGMETICKKYEIPFYADMYYNSTKLKPDDESNREKFYKADENGEVDNIHPNSEGHRIIAKYLQKKFEQNVIR